MRPAVVMDVGRGHPAARVVTEAERAVWSLIKEHGAARCRDAIAKEVYPQIRELPRTKPLSTQEAAE